ncbi:MAG: choice-of-anchor R domain-containing protein [Planctomycetota bacterium]
MRTLLTAAATFATLTQVATASDVIISNFGTPLGTGTNIGASFTTIYKAFGFTMGSQSYELDEVALSFNVTGTNPTPLLEIWSDAGGTPGAPLFTLDNPAVLAGRADFVFDASSEFILQANTAYWLYLRSVPMDGPSWQWEATEPDTLPAGAGATAIGYEFNGAPSSFFNRLEVRGTVELGASYCTANPNSSGAAGEISAAGSAVATDNDVTLTASNLPQVSFGFFLASLTQAFVPNPAGSEGNLCLGGSIGRYVGPGQIQNSGLTGTFSLALNLSQTPQPNGFVVIVAGETWNFQAWHRDANSSGPTSNFTQGISIAFQ